MNTTSLAEALGLSAAMGAVILFCRAFPFLFSPEKKSGSKAGGAFLKFVEKTVPPAAMTVLTFNALGGAFRENPREGLFALTASVFTALTYIWKRNSLVSIFGGTALYMILIRAAG